MVALSDAWTVVSPSLKGLRVVRPEDDDVLPRRTLRSRFVETCARGWLREAMGRGRLVIGELERVDASEASECDANYWGRRCPDLVRVTARNVAWHGKKKGDKAVLQLAALEAEVVNLHSRVLTKGKLGSMVARVAATGEDLDSSSIWQNFLFNVVALALGAPLVDKALTTIKDNRVTVTFFENSKTCASVSFNLAAKDGKLYFKNPDLDLKGSTAYRAAPFFYETLGETFLSSHNPTVDATSALYVAEVNFKDDTLECTIVSGHKSVDVHTLLEQSHLLNDGGPTITRRQKDEPLFALKNNKETTKKRAFAAAKKMSPKKYALRSDEDVRFGRAIVQDPATIPWPLWSSLVPRFQRMQPTHTVRPGLLPWFLDPVNAAPSLVVLAFTVLALAIHLTALPDEVLYFTTWLFKAIGRFFTSLHPLFASLASLLFGNLATASKHIAESIRLVATQPIAFAFNILRPKNNNFANAFFASRNKQRRPVATPSL